MPKALRGRKIYSLDLLNLSAGTSMRGEFEKRMKEIIAFMQRNKKEVIMFVDEIHTLVGAGKTAGSSDATQILKVPLARGEIVYVCLICVAFLHAYLVFWTLSNILLFNRHRKDMCLLAGFCPINTLILSHVQC